MISEAVRLRDDTASTRLRLVSQKAGTSCSSSCGGIAIANGFSTAFSSNLLLSDIGVKYRTRVN